MSDSSLSDMLTELNGYSSYDTHVKLPTPILQPNNGTLLYLQPLGLMLPPTTSILYTKLLYSRSILNSNPPIVKMTYLQPNCKYLPMPQLLS
jgi:hypothetical protein